MAKRLLAATTLLLIPAVAAAHGGAAGGFGAGFAHPLLGPDHLLALLGLGFWAARQHGGRDASAICLAFLVAVLVGFGLGLGAAPAAAAELGIIGSLAVIGALTVVGRRLSLGAAVLVAAGFALFHGHAHGTEMATGLSAMAFAAGFAVSTAAVMTAGAGLARHAARAQCLLPAQHCIGGMLVAASAYLLIVV